MAEISINQTADYFLRKSHEVGECLTNLKLQKLVYYAQAWYLAIYDKELFDAEFEAWIHGPVNRDLYFRFKKYLWQPITEDIEIPKLSKLIKEYLDEVFDVFGGISAYELERMTHNETPWIEARNGIPHDRKCSTPISQKTMKEFYKNLSTNDSKN